MSASGLISDICPICKEAFADTDDIVKIGQKGADGINAASAKREDSIVVTAGCKVHPGCRKWYINKRDIENQKKKDASSSNSVKRSKRVLGGPFHSKTDCLFCGTRVVLGRTDYSCVKTDDCTRTILQYCESRKDDWAFIVKGRIEYYGGDLHAADSIYHHICRSNFRNGYDIPIQFQGETSTSDAKRRKSGRPKDEDQEEAFERMCKYLEINDEEQLTVSFLQKKMKGFLMHEDSDPYGNQYLKIKLKEKYGDSICFAEKGD